MGVTAVTITGIHSLQYMQLRVSVSDSEGPFWWKAPYGRHFGTFYQTMHTIILEARNLHDTWHIYIYIERERVIYLNVQILDAQGRKVQRLVPCILEPKPVAPHPAYRTYMHTSTLLMRTSEWKQEQESASMRKGRHFVKIANVRQWYVCDILFTRGAWHAYALFVVRPASTPSVNSDRVGSSYMTQGRLRLPGVIRISCCKISYLWGSSR